VFDLSPVAVRCPRVTLDFAWRKRRPTDMPNFSFSFAPLPIRITLASSTMRSAATARFSNSNKGEVATFPVYRVWCGLTLFPSR
jgi:hypothetical protein